MTRYAALCVLLLAWCADTSPPATVYNAQIEQRDTSLPVHMVKKDDTASVIARGAGLTIDDILTANNLMSPQDIRPGTRLYLAAPGNGPTMPTGQNAMGGPQPAGMAPVEPVQFASPGQEIETETLAPLGDLAAAPAQSAVSTTVAAAPAPVAMPSAPVRLSSFSSDQWADPVTSGLRWPVRGPTLSKFGQKTDGLRNDGINIGATPGTPVEAAGDGEVVYAGNAVEGFGNLVLVKHKGGVVTAYGHLSRIDVAKGQTLRAGDILGGVGESGSVGAPQLHFQVRHAGKIADPGAYLRNGPETMTAGL